MKYSSVFIDAIGYALAPVVVTSDEIEDRITRAYRALNIEPGSLASLTGIQERRYWPKGATVTAGATAAAIDALHRASISSRELGTLVYAGVCREHFEPATACHVARQLLPKHPLSETLRLHDVSNACLGVMTAILDVANHNELGHVSSGMVVACERAREIVDIAVDQLDREPTMERFKASLATLTGGAAAVAIVLSNRPGDAGHRLLGGISRSAPAHDQLCRWGIEHTGPGAEDFTQFAVTDSTAVLQHGVGLGQRTWNAFLQELQWTPSDVHRTVCHQIGSGHRDAILPRLELDPRRDFVTYPYLGNTGSTALPVALALASQRGFVEPGHNVGLLGIGSGLVSTMLGVQW